MKTQVKIVLSGVVAMIVIVGLALLFRNTTIQAPRDLSDIISSGKIYVVSENSSTGFNSETDSIYGFQYEILKKFAERIGVETEVAMVNDLKRCMNDLQHGRYDVIAKFIPTTTEWKGKVAFTNPLLSSRQMLVQRIDQEGKLLVNKPGELANDTVYIPLHSPQKMRLEHLSAEIADTIYIEELRNKTSEELIAMVSEGEINYTISHEQLSRKFSRDYENIDASVPVSMLQPYSWAVHLNSPELLRELNEFLSEFIGSLAYWELYRKYY